MNECREIQRRVWMGDTGVPGVEAHLEHCPACRTELRQAGELRAALSGLQGELAPVPAGLQAVLTDAVQRTRSQRAREVVYHPRFLRGAAVGAAAATAAAFGVIVVRRLARPDLVA